MLFRSNARLLSRLAEKLERQETAKLSVTTQTTAWAGGSRGSSPGQLLRIVPVARTQESERTRNNERITNTYGTLRRHVQSGKKSRWPRGQKTRQADGTTQAPRTRRETGEEARPQAGPTSHSPASQTHCHPAYDPAQAGAYHCCDNPASERTQEKSEKVAQDEAAWWMVLVRPTPQAWRNTEREESAHVRRHQRRL